MLKFFTAIGLLFGTVVVHAGSTAPGFLEGQLKIETSGGARLADETSSKTEPAYADYPLVVLSRDGRTELAQVVADKEGHYRVALPPGDYFLDVKRRGRRPLAITQRPFKVVSEQTVHVDMEIAPDLRVM